MPDWQPYRPPAGKVDFPYYYIYDASQLVDGSTYQNNRIQLDGDSTFILRAIRGVTNCVDTAANGGKWNFRTPGQVYPNSVANTGIFAQVNEPVMPEFEYPVAGSIFFDLYNVLRNTTACGMTPIYNSFLAFCGVKRFDDTSPYRPYITSYKFKRVPQTYVVPLTISQAHFATNGAANPAQRLQTLVQNYDFELYSMRISQSGSNAPLLTNDFQITLYDRWMHATSNLPVNQGYFNSARTTSGSTATGAPPYRAAFPCPILIYPNGSSIIMDITSMLCSTSIPQTYTISLVGCWRFPC